MEENNEQLQAEEFLKNLPVQTEDIAFKPEELISCKNCARTNPPNRLKCVYCGAELELSAEQSAKIAPTLRKLENWENGFNLIYLPKGENINDETTAQIAKFIGLDSEILQNIFESKKPLPIVRVESLKEAEIFQNRLRESGLESSIIGDESLSAENFPKRLRGLEFEDDKILLILFNNDEVEVINIADLSLIVSGAIFEKSVESQEKRKKGENKILEASETFSDEILVDIYTKNDSTGYRILTKGFDFSCLEGEKGILARDNIKKLVVKLHTIAPNAKLINDYLSLRNVLGEIWEVEQRKDSKGLSRQRFGKFDLSNISSSNNLQQFTKYSRLQWQIL
jgi:hypothetical protein